MQKTKLIANIIRFEVHEFTRNRPFALFICAGPIVFALLLTAILWQGVMQGIPVAVWDADNSAQSREFLSMLGGSPAVTVSHRVGSADEGMALIKSGKVYGLCIVPGNFASDLLAGKGANIALRYNNQFLTQGSVINKAFTELTATFAAKYNSIKYMSAGVPYYALEGYVQPVNVHNMLLYNSSLDYSWFLLMGLLPVIWQLFGIGGTIYILARNLDLTNSPLPEIARSKTWWPLCATLMPHLLLFLVQFYIIALIMFGVAGIPLNGSRVLVALGSVLFIMATVSVGSLFVAVGKELGRSASAGSVFVSPAFAYAGATFPFESMPFFAQVWSELLPITHYHRLLVDVALRNAGLEAALVHMGALALFTLLCAPVAIALYRWRLAAVGVNATSIGAGAVNAGKIERNKANA
ncbi:ABC transporter permease [Desulfovibrio sp. OttesenSCG-928-F07]|nr:ABC transporter permease [Desulfovibrio sp. OttesenSCG-928-F07]